MKGLSSVLLLSFSCGVFAATNVPDTLPDRVAVDTASRPVDRDGGYVSSKSDYDMEKEQDSGGVVGVVDDKIGKAGDGDLN
ncbi:hypothetical protein [Candidatus Ichthyocystis hellenicum]|uniref:hypothetical protein n=1 Tax=Candidatus Ichthyocystis hellenicum TaxID=1561003 RepID=UPI000B88FCD6|nr:hypothetical protein [Candidatus Ichthyocystis hellenicum]